MKRWNHFSRWMLRSAAFLLLMGLPVMVVFGWGYDAHSRINSDAVDTLPLEMRPFFEANREFLTTHAPDPDRWKRDDEDEAVRHYLDLDLYGAYPFKMLPRDYDEAAEKYTEEKLRSGGVLPWRIVEYTHKLADDMKSGDKDEILLTAAALGHYVADAHMPLHTAENYNGQLTGNSGIHSQFERNMVNENIAAYSPVPEEAKPIEDVLDYTFDILLSSYSNILELLQSDSRAREDLSPALLDSITDWRAKPVDEYMDSLYAGAGDLAWQQMNQASNNLGRYWLTAWVIAGKPSLPE